MASAALVAAAAGIAFVVVRDDALDDGAGADVAAGPGTIAPDPTVAATAPMTTAVPTTAPPTTVDPNLVEVGQGVRFRLPEGFTAAPVGAGVEITDGRLRYYAQVATRTPGDDPRVVMQEYVDGFDGLYPSAAYSQVIPRPIDTSGATPSDGVRVYYRAMAADGTGYKGVIDVARRADGLVVLTDLFTDLADESGSALPAGVADELYASFLHTPAVGPEAELGALEVSRLASVHPSAVVDDVIAVTPPAGWTIEVGGPGRVLVSYPTGQRFAAGRLADTADPGIAQDQSFAELQTAFPGAVLGGFAPSREGGAVVSFDSTFSATADDGVAVQGVVRLWVDTTTGEVVHAISWAPVGTALQPGHETFLFATLDISLTQPH